MSKATVESIKFCDLEFVLVTGEQVSARFIPFVLF